MPLENLLRKYAVKVYSRKGNTTVNIEVPTLQEAFAITPMPWASGRSWARGIEVGISGLGQYLAIEAASSRSGEGIQTKMQLEEQGLQELLIYQGYSENTTTVLKN